MISKELHEIHAIMINGLDDINIHNWSKTFQNAKQFALFETSFYRNGFNFSIMVTAEQYKK